MAALSRKFVVPALAASVLAIGGAAYAWKVTHYINVPGPITGSYAGGVKGSFKFVEVGITQGIPSAPNGGACIIFRAEDLGFAKMAKKNCNSDKQCSVKGEGSGYCEPTTHHCWARPNPETATGSDDALCRRGDKLPNPVPIDKPIAIPVSGTPAAISTPSWKISPHAKARVLTRLNCLGNAACGPGGDTFVLRWGTAKQL